MEEEEGKVLQAGGNWFEWVERAQEVINAEPIKIEDDFRDMHEYIYTSTSKLSSRYDKPKLKICNPGEIISAYGQKWVVKKTDILLGSNLYVCQPVGQGVVGHSFYSSEVEEVYG